MDLLDEIIETIVQFIDGPMGIILICSGSESEEKVTFSRLFTGATAASTAIGLELKL